MQTSELLTINFPKASSRKASIVSSSAPPSPHFIQNNLSHDLIDILRGFVDELCEIFIEARQRGKPDANTCKLFTDYLKSQNQNVEQIFECLLNNTHRPEYTALLGYFYSKGIGTKPSFRKAYSLYLSEAKKDFFLAQDLVGDCYYLGRGTIKDCRMAFEWYQKAADNGSIGALISLGMCYYLGEGKGTKKDIKKAKFWNKEAANDNYKAANKRAKQTQNKNKLSQKNGKKEASYLMVLTQPSIKNKSSPKNVNLHESPSEPSNNVNSYEYPESSFEDLLSNNANVFSKSEVIDLEPFVENDLPESPEESFDTIISDPSDEPSFEECEIIIPVESCSEPSAESDLPTETTALHESSLEEPSNNFISEITDIPESFEQSFEQSSENIIPVTSCPEHYIEGDILSEIADPHVESSEQSSEIIIPDTSCTEPSIERDIPSEIIDPPVESSEIIIPESSIESNTPSETTDLPVESSEIINKESSIESNISLETTDPHECPPVELSEITNQEPELSIESNSSPEEAIKHESSPKPLKNVDQGSSVDTKPSVPTKKKRKRCSKLEQVEKRINRRIKWYKKNLYDEVNYELLEDFPAWLRGCEMDKYASLFEGKRWQDIVKMKYKDLKELGIDHHESAWQLQSNFWIVNCDLAAKKGKTLPYKGGVDRINIDLELLNDFPEYLKTIGMEQYAPLFAGKNWKEIIDMDHKDLKALKVESVSHRIDMVKKFWVMRRKIYHTKRVNKCVLIPSKKRTKIPDVISEFEDPKEDLKEESKEEQMEDTKEEVVQSNESDE
ncbi:3818_t:CDS:10 [Cetraspora pellucida]|uniref:3818_t:CDS:1 n=1 Tax=Cetraspora pellucida TaxID=1433469 RepID=A0ACA9LMT5_9GLOM|nr:3818_t:CDS:10 [Cetraspora pellucida]